MNAPELLDARGLIQTEEWVKSKTWPHSNGRGLLRVVDLFSGLGGLTLGTWEGARFCDARIEVSLAVELDPVFAACYKRNFGSLAERVFECDVNGVLSWDELDRVNPVDLIVAGPPCQGHSNLNNHSRRTDERNTLYLTVAEFARILKPQALLIENVQAVVHDKGMIVDQTTSALREIGYHVKSFTVSALAFGLPQRRKRHIVVASKFPLESLLPVPLLPFQTACLYDFIGDLEDEPDQNNDIFTTPSEMTLTNRERADYLLQNNLYDLPDDLRPPCHRYKLHSYKSMYGRLHWDLPAQTITSGFGSMGQGRYLHPSRPRTITPHEAARIQGLPDFFDLTGIHSRVKLAETIANAVPPQITAHLVSELMRIGALHAR